MTVTAQEVRLHVREWSSAGPVCVLIHGTGESTHVWDQVVVPLKASWRVLGIDLRGHGDSPWDEEGRYTLPGYVADVRYTLDSLGIERFAVVGHSLGGAVAICLAAEMPTRVTRLVVVDYGPEVCEDSREHARAVFLSQLRTYRTVDEYVSLLSETRPMVSEQALRRIAVGALRRGDQGFQLKCDPEVVRDDGNDAEEAMAIVAALPRVACPTLVVRGRASALLSQARAQRMVYALKRGSLREIADAGHAVMADNPAAFSDVLAGFLVASGNAASR